MPLVDIELSTNDSVLPDDVVAFLNEADLRVSQSVRNTPVRVAGFVPCDFVTVYHALRAIAEANIASGTSFCEWGSGFGVVASLATILEFRACGIEIEGGLVEDSRKLADDFDLPVEFIHGSFIPPSSQAFVEQAYADNNSESAWLITDADDAYDELGLEPDDFDIIFAYPWPGEEDLISDLFERCAAEGALLLMYNEYNSMTLRRKVNRRTRGY